MRLGRAGTTLSLIVAVVALSAASAAPAWAGSPPSVDGISEHYGVAGAEVRVDGNNFEEVIEVRFGSVGTTTFAASGNVIEVKAPEEAPGTVHVTVVTASGVSEATPADLFTYMAFPGYGRCLRVSIVEGVAGWGEWKTNRCVTESEIFAPYTWWPAFGPKLPLQKTHFTNKGGEVKLETVGKKLIVCTAESGTGEYTSTQAVAETLTLSGCHLGVAGCQSAGASAGEVHTGALSGQLGRAPVLTRLGEVRKLAQEIGAASGEVVAEFECAGTPVTVTGAVIGEVAKEAKMTTTTTWKAKGSKGAEKLKTLIGGTEATLHVKVGAGGSEAAGLTESLTQTSEEEIEIL